MGLLRGVPQGGHGVRPGIAMGLAYSILYQLLPVGSLIAINIAYRNSPICVLGLGERDMRSGGGNPDPWNSWFFPHQKS